MKIPLKKYNSTKNYANIAIECPHCGYNGTFVNTDILDLISYHNDNWGNEIQIMLGLRECPNKDCKGHLFFISDKNGSNDTTMFTSPSSVISFNRNNIPENILNAFEEAVKCHSNNCFIASAIMIRKTLEEICAERNAEGKNLFFRLKDLAAKILIPKELIEAMDELRLLGNDAAHIEAQTFNEVGKNEIEISIEFTKEVLKAVYQYESLLTKLRSLKSPPIT